MNKTLLTILAASVFSVSNAYAQNSYEQSKIHQELEYERTARKVIELSKQQGYSLLVNKQERKAYLFKNGEIDTTFNVGLGQQPEGDKLYEGDMRTPEGIYKIEEKRDGINGRPSEFGLAFLLDYPTDKDREEFRKAKKQGLVPKGVKGPGSAIEIHSGPDNRDWTYGCMAIKPEGMKILFKKIEMNDSIGIINYFP